MYFEMISADVPDYGIFSDDDDVKAKIGNSSGLYPFNNLVDTSVPTLVDGMNSC